MTIRWAVRRSADECACRRKQSIAGRGRCNQFEMKAEEQRAAVPAKGKHPEETGSWPERGEVMLLDYKPIQF